MGTTSARQEDGIVVRRGLLLFFVAVVIFFFSLAKPAASQFVMWCATTLTVIYALSLFLTGLVEKRTIEAG